MKNKLRRKLTALALCGVMIFSGSSSALADSQAGEIDENQIVQEQVLDEVIEEADTEVQEPAVEEATQELVPETVEQVIEEAPVEEVVEEVVEEQPQVEIQEVEAQPTVVEQVVEAVSTATEKVVEVVETVIRYIIGIHDDLTYEDDQVIIKVYAEEDEIIPEGTKIKVVPILADDEATKAQYEEVAAGLQEKAAADEQIIEGFLAYDITLVDPEGNEFEPNGEVKVTMDYKKAALPAEVENVEEAEVTIHHFEEDANGEVKQIVDMVAEAAIEAVVEVTEAAEVEKAEFVTTSFSTYTITWSSNAASRAIAGTVVTITGTELNVTDRTINLQPVTGTDSVDLSETAFETMTVNGSSYVFEKVVLCQGNYSSSKEIEVTSISYVDGVYRANGNEGYVITNTPTGYSLYIVYKKTGTITTIDSIANHVNIHLTDYSRWSSESRSNEVIYNINSGHGLQFYTSGSTSSQPTYNAYTNGSNPRQGFLRSYLEADYPYLKAAGNNSAESLEYLFNNSTKTYTANHLFKDDGGYYVYDSAVNFAELDTATGNFTVYNDDKNGFFPFNKYTEAVQTNAASQYAVTNHHFGMHVDFTFMQPKNGNVGTAPMEFEFHGDDDVWVFIDGMLVLDLGGIHQKTGGTINFATGVVDYTAARSADSNTNPDTTIYAMYVDAWEEAGKTTQEIANLTNQYFVQDTSGNYRFKDYSQHKLDFFYLERGAHDTNCKIKFNLIAIPENTISIEKEITETNMADFADATFKFRLETSALDTNSSTGSYLPRSVFADQKYKLYEVNGSQKTLVDEKYTDENGEFELKHRQLAEFEGIPASTKYWVTELDVVSDEYDEVKFNGKTTITNGDNQEIGNGDFSTGELLAQECVYVKFQNKCNAENHRNLVINKVMAEGQTSDEAFRIKLEFADDNNWVPYVGTYYVGATQEEALAEEPLTTDDGIITLNAGQSAYIIGLISDTEYKVTEVLSVEQQPNFAAPLYSGTGRTTSTVDPITDVIDLEDTNTVYIATVTNTLLTQTVNVEKEWIDSNSTHEAVYVGLYDEGGAVEYRELNSTNEWKASFTNLDLNAKYKVKELVQGSNNGTSDFMIGEEGEKVGYIALVEGAYYSTETDFYTVSYSSELNKEANTVNVKVTNTALNKVLVQKVWKDANNEYGTRPEALVITIADKVNPDVNTSFTLGKQLDNTSVYNGTLVINGKTYQIKINGWSAQIFGLDVSSYDFTEDSVVGYNSNGVNVNQSEGTVTFTNTIDVQIAKESKTGKIRLGGAVFKLTDEATNTSYYGGSEDGNGHLQWFANYSSEGELSTPVTPANGTYVLSEVKAPAGYSASEEKWDIKVVDGVFVVFDITTDKPVQINDMLTPNYNEETGKTTYVYEVCFLNEALYELPSTGGFGIYVPMMSGVIMMMAAAFILMNNKRKEVL